MGHASRAHAGDRGWRSLRTIVPVSAPDSGEHVRTRRVGKAATFGHGATSAMDSRHDERQTSIEGAVVSIDWRGRDLALILPHPLLALEDEELFAALFGPAQADAASRRPYRDQP